MDITGAELIIRFLEQPSLSERAAAKDVANAVAVIPGGSALRVLAHALEDSALKRAPATDAGVLFFDFRTDLAQAADVLADARTQRRPLVCIAGQVRRGLMGTDACQPEARRILSMLTKSWFHIGAAMELLELLPAAFRIARRGPRGPVLLEIPEDVLGEVLQGAWIPRIEPRAPRPRINRTSPLFA